MEQPTWITDNLLTAIYFLQLHLGTEATVTYSREYITICRHDGLIYQAAVWIEPPMVEELAAVQEPAAVPTSPPVSDPLTIVVTTASEEKKIEDLPNVQVKIEDSSPTLVVPTYTSEFTQSPSTLEGDAQDPTSPPAAETFDVTLIALDVNSAPRLDFPELAPANGTSVRGKVRDYIRRMVAEHQKTNPSQPKLIHYAYLFGKLLKENQKEVRRILPEFIQAERTRSRYITGCRYRNTVDQSSAPDRK